MLIQIITKISLATRILYCNSNKFQYHQNILQYHKYKSLLKKTKV